MWPKYFQENSVDFSDYCCQCVAQEEDWLLRVLGLVFLREKELLRRSSKVFLIYATVLVMMQFLGHIVTWFSFPNLSLLGKREILIYQSILFNYNTFKTSPLQSGWKPWFWGRNWMLTAPYKWVLCKPGLILVTWGMHYEDMSHLSAWSWWHCTPMLIKRSWRVV